MTKGPSFVIGVDPGVKGGMALINAIAGRLMAVVSFANKKTVDEVVAAMVGWKEFLSGDRVVVYIEKVHFIKGDGGKGSFTFGRIDGGLLWGWKCLGFKVKEVPPTTWMSHMNCMTGGEKNVSKNRAKVLFPDYEKKFGVTHAVADAILIAEFGRHKEIELAKAETEKGE